jgi:hypothetical protein
MPRPKNHVDPNRSSSTSPPKDSYSSISIRIASDTLQKLRALSLRRGVSIDELVQMAVEGPNIWVVA